MVEEQSLIQAGFPGKYYIHSNPARSPKVPIPSSGLFGGREKTSKRSGCSSRAGEKVGFRTGARHRHRTLFQPCQNNPYADTGELGL
jgi:hypothetical protein